MIELFNKQVNSLRTLRLPAILISLKREPLLLKKIWVGIGFILISMNTLAQDFTNQINALEQSFEKKDIKYLEEHLSSELQFDTIPATYTVSILERLIGQFPELKKVTIIKTRSLKVTIELEFPGVELQESFISFDEQGKIVSIEFIENLVRQLLEDQHRTSQSITGPSPDQLNLPYTVKKIEIPSKDGIIITGNLYEVDKDAPVILLCHQAGFNKFEYADIAPRLNALGFNCLAIDQRSGGTFADAMNETHQMAKDKGIKKLDYLDAQPDIETALDFLSKRYNKKIVIWGSSYSASLALYIGATSDKVEGIISFSPGNYFGNNREPLEKIFKKLNKPFFVTSSKSESYLLSLILSDKILNNVQAHFVPEDYGLHGSRILWNGQKGANEYWVAVSQFLSTMKR